MHSHGREPGSAFAHDGAAAGGKVTLSLFPLKIPSPAGVGEQRVLAPLGHVAMVISMVNSLRGVVAGQVVRGRILGRTGAAPLAQRLLGAVRAIDVVAYHPGFAGLSHGHVENARVVLWAGVLLRATRGRADVMSASLRRVMLGDRRHIRDSGLKATAS